MSDDESLPFSVEAVFAVMRWAREERLVLARIKVGNVEVDIAADLTLASQAPSIANPVSQADAYEQYGGPALRRILSEENAEEVTSEVLEE